MTDLIHYTLNTGHTRASPRSEVGNEIITLMTPWLEPGEYDLPEQFPGHRVVVPLCEHGFGFTVYGGKAPLVTCGVADTDQAAAEVWPALESMYLKITDRQPFAGAGSQAPKMPVYLPWLSVVLVFPSPAVEWLGDFERCLAWAWLERKAKHAPG
jgi:hypothetical protein